MADDVSALLDQFGKPFARWEIAQLRDTLSEADAGKARPPFQGHLAFGMDPGRLGGILRAADAGNSMEWFILAEEIEELFPHYSAVLSKRKRQVAQLPVTVEAAEDVPDGEVHATFVRKWIATGALARVMFDILDAVGKGFSVHEIMWETKTGSVRPSALAYRPQRFFELDYQDGATLWLRTEMGFQDLAPHKFLVHRHPSKSGLAVRSGLTRLVAFLWMFSSYTLKDWALFCQGYGMPIRVGRYGPEAGENDKRVLWRAVSSIAGDVAAIIPRSMEIEFVKGGDTTAGSELYLKRADWLNREVSKLVLGSTAGTEAISGGHAVGQEHRQVEDDVEKFDAGLVGTSITLQIVPAMIAFTFGPQPAYPVVQIGRPNEVPLKEIIAAVTDLGPLGLKVKTSQLLERLQLTEPEEGDATVGGVPPAPVIKPIITRPQVAPQTVQTGAWLGKLVTRHAEVPPELVEQMTERLGEEAAGALAGMTAQLREAFEDASDMHDLAQRVAKLNLDPAAFAEAMTRGMALANLVGQASLVDSLRGS